MVISNKSCITSFIFLLLAFQVACGQVTNAPSNKNEKTREQVDSRLENLKKQADELITALSKNDFDKFIELTHPKVMEAVGGKENFVPIMKKVMDENPKIFESFSMSVGNPNLLVETDGQLFGVVPQKIEGTTHAKHKVVVDGCIIGVSNDNGKTWKFVNGEKFDELFPSLKGKLQIITRKTFVDGVEK